MSFKVMLLYPNLKGMNMLPPAIGLLSAILKNNNIEVKLFDTTYYNELDGMDIDSDDSKTDKLMARPYKMPKEVKIKYSDAADDFKKAVEQFLPDLIAVSATEDMFLIGIGLLKKIKYMGIPVIIGGVFPTFAPELVLSYPEIDIVCRGEGEEALPELCKRLDKGKSYDDIPNLWVKKIDGSITKNQLKMADMNKNPLIDMSIFDEARFYRPMGGKVWRMFPVETHRGCPYTCAYCNSPNQTSLYRSECNELFLRRKTFSKMREELLYYKNVMGAEYLYFWADTFFSWKPGEFDEFCELYRDIDLPFWCQTRVETVKKSRFKKLRDIGCARISFGLEHGNEKFRNSALNRKTTNRQVLDSLKIVDEVGIPYSVNNMMGFPGETYELAFDTIRLNRQINAVDRNAYAFVPFHGTPLRGICEEQNLVNKNDIVKSMVSYGSILDMPQFPRKKVNALTKCFNLYVGLPEDMWPEIKKAEEETDEGRAIYAKLKQDYIDRHYTDKATSG